MYNNLSGVKMTHNEERISCSICWRVLPESETVLIGYEAVCFECAEEHYCTCTACGELVEVAEIDERGRCSGCSDEDVPPRVLKWHEL
jgi:hypothetical protein